MRVAAPAKVNLSLRVLARRADGFHEIETLMVPISLADELEIEPGGEGVSFTCSDPTIPGDETNLVVRAARLFFSEAGLPAAVRIALTKNIPHGAGLGGGSSDAAATLFGLNDLFRAGLSHEKLVALAAQLGSDVPFFIFRSAAICRGRGELVTPVEFTHRLPMLLLKPPFAVETPSAYARWQNAMEIPGIDYTAQEFPWGTLVNDLERPVFEKFLFLAQLKRWLREQPETDGALMSGSGSTMLAVLKSADAGGTLAARAKCEFGESLWTCACTPG